MSRPGRNPAHRERVFHSGGRREDGRVKRGFRVIRVDGGDCMAGAGCGMGRRVDVVASLAKCDQRSAVNFQVMSDLEAMLVARALLSTRRRFLL